MKKQLIGLFLIIFVALISCNSENKDWDETKTQNTEEAYTAFLKNYPESVYKDTANTKIQEFSWAGTKRLNTIEVFNRFAEDFPDNVFQDSVRISIENIVWEEVETANTIDAYKDYIKGEEFVNYKGTAKNKLEALLWIETKKLNNKKAYLEFLEEYGFEGYIDSVKIDFSLDDFRGYAVYFLREEGEEGKGTTEEVFIKFSKNGSVSGNIKGTSFGDGFGVAWEEEIKGRVEDDFIILQTRMTDFSDVSEFEPEDWGSPNNYYFSDNILSGAEKEYVFKNRKKEITDLPNYDF